MNIETPEPMDATKSDDKKSTEKNSYVPVRRTLDPPDTDAMNAVNRLENAFEGGETENVKSEAFRQAPYEQVLMTMSEDQKKNVISGASPDRKNQTLLESARTGLHPLEQEIFDATFGKLSPQERQIFDNLNKRYVQTAKEAAGSFATSMPLSMMISAQDMNQSIEKDTRFSGGVALVQGIIRNIAISHLHDMDEKNEEKHGSSLLSRAFDATSGEIIQKFANSHSAEEKSLLSTIKKQGDEYFKGMDQGRKDQFQKLFMERNGNMQRLEIAASRQIPAFGIGDRLEKFVKENEAADFLKDMKKLNEKNNTFAVKITDKDGLELSSVPTLATASALAVSVRCDTKQGMTAKDVAKRLKDDMRTEIKVNGNEVTIIGCTTAELKKLTKVLSAINTEKSVR